MKILLLLREAEHLTWLRNVSPRVIETCDIATFDPVPGAGITKRFDPDADMSAVVEWVRQGAYTHVLILSNQKGLLVDAEIRAVLRSHGISVFSQSQEAAQFGASKITQKKALENMRIKTPPFAVAETVGAALSAAEQLGFPLVAKVAGLSDGRKMRFLEAREDVASYYYDFAIAESVILEKYIEGREISTIVAVVGGKTAMYPIVYKPLTSYLKTNQKRPKMYFSPHPEVQPLTEKIAGLAFEISKKQKNDFLMGIDMVNDRGDISIIEVNARVVETLRMSILATGYDPFECFLGLSEPQEGVLPPKRIVADVPYTRSLEDAVNIVRSNNCEILANTATRISFCGRNIEFMGEIAELIQ